MKKPYQSPALREVGSVTKLTQQNFNKVGGSTDAASQVITGLIGSYVNYP